MAMRRYAPPMPWAPPTPTPTRSPWPKVLAVLAVAALVAAIWFRAGLFGLVLAALLGLLHRNRPDKGRVVAELLAAGMLALVLTGAPAPKAPALPKVKAPAKVEASQADLLEQAQKVWAEAYAQTIGKGLTKETGR